ncbi:hypothetical protein GCM10020254_84210 [Streptomyces goshikiensis]
MTPFPSGRASPSSRTAPGQAPWSQEFQGEIDGLEAPELLAHPMAEEGELVYWVAFDEPQYDSDGAGPYRKAQVWGRYLKRAEDS